MINRMVFALAAQDMGIQSSVLIGGFIFAVLFIISFGWITKGPGLKNYGRFQQRDSSGS